MNVIKVREKKTMLRIHFTHRQDGKSRRPFVSVVANMMTVLNKQTANFVLKSVKRVTQRDQNAPLIDDRISARETHH